MDPNFADFLLDDSTWEKKTRTNPLRGFENDTDAVPAARRRTAQQKVTHLELMLGQIANYCPIISRNSIVRNSTSLKSIWQAIRMHFGFHSTGAHFIDFAGIKLEHGERPEDLYQRLMAFVEDNLLKSDGGITHHDETPSEDEDLSPSLENFVVLVWLQLIHKDLPRLVKQRYGTELRSHTLASIKPEISQALSSLLDEIHATEDARIMRTGVSNYNQSRQGRPSFRNTVGQRRPPRSKPSCPLCKQAGRNSYDHFLSKCQFLPESDKKFMIRARLIAALDEEHEESIEKEFEPDQQEPTVDKDPSLNMHRVQVKQSPFINLFYHHHPLKVVIDSGAEANMIRESIALQIGAKIIESSQVALQADGLSSLIVKGETKLCLTRDGKQFFLDALVVENMDCDILAGIPFMAQNDITICPARHEVILTDGTKYHYGGAMNTGHLNIIRRAQAYVLRAPASTTTIWPGEFIELEVPKDIPQDVTLALEPRTDSDCSQGTTLWPLPDIITSVGRKVRIPNDTDTPKILKRNDHFCQIQSVFSPSIKEPYTNDSISVPEPKTITKGLHSDQVILNPDDLLDDNTVTKFNQLHEEFDSVYDPNFPGYNGAYGPIKGVVNMGPVLPPQRKGRIPQYSRDKLGELQNKFDDLERMGVFKRPEDIGIVAEYLSPSFLVRKTNGNFRLVTAFADVGRYSKPQPSLLPDVNSTLRSIARWKYIIKSDLTSAFYQIPLSTGSMKYCGVVTPFKGVRVYSRCAMGIPGSETALEELMCRVLGDLVQEGVSAKIADDLYVGGDTPDDLLSNWRKVLEALNTCDLRLSASKTVIAPKSTNILGWIWSQGTIHASPHRIATLSTCDKPSTVHGLRSFIGAYKVLARVIPNCAHILSPLEDAVAGRNSQDKLTWSDSLHDAYKRAQQSLIHNKSIVLPKPTDQLWIVTDGAAKKHGLGSTLYVTRGNNKPRLAGFFSAKLRKRQTTWIPCEVEALSITASVKHFSPYILQSNKRSCVLTDNKPCVQAFEKLCRGEFSTSTRVTTFLTALSHYQVSVQHLAGSANTPSDFQSRNAPDCNEPNCQICTFIAQTEDSVVRSISVKDILSGSVKLPFTSRSAWLSTQQECPDLRRTHSHLIQGTRPSKKLTNVKDVKRYLHVASIGKDGLLVVKRNEPFTPSRECIIIPRSVLPGLLTALHIKLEHPSSYQLKQVAHRYFYALDMDSTIEDVTTSCHQCSSMKKIPHTLIEQSTSDPPEVIGTNFAADVMHRNRQLILVLRECVSSYTVASLIENEQHTSLRDALISMCINLRPLDGPVAVIRTDPGPGFLRLVDDPLLQQYRISLEIGRVKNTNKNPVAEKAIQELENELLRQEPSGGHVSSLTLTIATCHLNSRIRHSGLSAREIWTQRDQFSNEQLPISDRDLIQAQHHQRIDNHPHSEKCKAPRGKEPPCIQINVGDLVYLYSDRNKSCTRNRYLVVSVEGQWCFIRKFVGNQLRNNSYRVKTSECYKVPADYNINSNNKQSLHASDPYVSDEDEFPPQSNTCTPLNIPTEISTPAELPSSAEINFQQENLDNRNIQPLDSTDMDSALAPDDLVVSIPESVSVDEEQASEQSNTSPPPLAPRRSSRRKQTPKYLQDYKLY